VCPSSPKRVNAKRKHLSLLLATARASADSLQLSKIVRREIAAIADGLPTDALIQLYVLTLNFATDYSPMGTSR
jgi:hypothetical protein